MKLGLILTINVIFEHILTRVSISTFPSFNLSMFTEEDGTTVNNQDKKAF